MRRTDKIYTYCRLGLSNLFDVFYYRLEKKLNRHRKLLSVVGFSEGVFFRNDASLTITGFGDKYSIKYQADNLLAGKLIYFSSGVAQTTVPPRWRCTVEGVEAGNVNQHWSDIPDFNLAVGDIKTVWEPSRFDWLLVLTRAYRASGQSLYLETINNWLQDWCRENPVNGGPNWKCGQESSLRMMQSLLAAYLLGQHTNPEPMLVEFVAAHCRRIVPTLRYAMAQDNNHGTSEAAALFIAGYWLESVKASDAGLVSTKEIKKFQFLGRKWLENRAKKLIMEDGSFSQHSVNYHRVMLDTFSMAEFWRIRLEAAAFTERFYQRARVATSWLQTMTNPVTGDVPNMGANDGARLFVLTDTDYRDYRPSVQLASTLFFNSPVYGEGSWNDQLRWLGLAILEQVEKTGQQLPVPALPLRASQLFDQGGYCFLREEQCDLELFIRYPRFRFRPSHADALHLDLWWKGNNIIRDGGTFSYNPRASSAPEYSSDSDDKEWLDYFPGTESHSTVQFDNRDQMPRISRFLFGNWLKPDFVEPIEVEGVAQTWAAQYTDSFGASHKRAVRLEPERLVVTDSVLGFNDKAVLRWRLCPGEWSFDGNQAVCDGMVIIVSVNQKPAVMRVVEGFESRYYNEINSLPVLEIEVTASAEFQTVFLFS